MDGQHQLPGFVVRCVSMICFVGLAGFVVAVLVGTSLVPLALIAAGDALAFWIWIRIRQGRFP
jgi:hypothetical protein